MMYNIWKSIKLSFDRSFSDSWWKQLLWLVGLALLLMIAGWAILACHEEPKDVSMWKTLAYFLDTDSFHNDIDIDITVPPLFSVIFTFLGMVVMGGALVSVIVNILTGRVEDFRKGWIRYGFRGHTVILGSGDMLMSMARHFCGEGGDDIVVLTTSDVENLRDSLKTSLTGSQMRRITLLYGRRDSKEQLLAMKIWRARKIWIIGQEGEPEHDTVNIHSLELVRDICAEKGNTEAIPCSVVFEYQSSIFAIRYARYANILTQKNDRTLLDLTILNFYESWARNVFVSGRSGATEYAPLDHKAVTADSDRFVHLVVVGMTRMGNAMAETAAHIAHFPNFARGKKTLITFIDPDARREKDLFTGRHNTLFEMSGWSFRTENGCEEHPAAEGGFLDVEWEFVEGGIEMPWVRRMLEEWAADSDRVLTLAVCGRSPAANVAAATYLPDKVYENAVPVLVYQKSDSALVDITRLSGRYATLRPFGMTSGMFDGGGEERMRDGRRINYLYDHRVATGAYVRAFPPDNELIPAWNALPMEHQISSIYAADTIPIKYRSMGIPPEEMASHDFTEAQTETLAEMEHRRWTMEKLLLDYRPLTPGEAAEIESASSREERDGLTKFYRDNHYAHSAIRPFDQLDYSVSDYDRCIIKGFKLIINENKELIR